MAGIVWRFLTAAFISIAVCCGSEQEPTPAAPPRIIAMGDVHGDLAALRRALELGGLTNSADQWIGETSVLVQTGDLLDRGDDELEILGLLESLKAEAQVAGGAVHLIAGNHQARADQGVDPSSATGG